MYKSFNARALGLGLSARETIDLAAVAGFEGVDLLVRDLIDAGEDPAELRRRMDDLGLRGGAWPLPVTWRGDAARFRADLGRLPLLAEAAAALGLFRTGTWVMVETPEAPGTEAAREAHRRDVVALHLERLGAIARVLAAHGTRLGLEVIGVPAARTGRGLPFVGRLADLDGTLGPIWAEAPNLGVTVDAFHLHAAGEAPEAGLAWGVDRVVSVHVADLPAGADGDRAAIRDGDRGLPGESGLVDLDAFLSRLAEAGYDGPVTVEPLAGCRSLAGLGPGQAAHRVAAALATVWPGPPGGGPDA